MEPSTGSEARSDASFRAEDPVRHAGASGRSGGRNMIGVLALQGAFRAHVDALTDLGVAARDVRTPAHLDGVDALVMPGGESTTMSRLLTSSGLFDQIKARASEGMAVFGTCAGMILLATEVLDGRPDQRTFGIVDLTVRRNGYGRQLASFEADLDLGDDGGPMRGVFIRAPRVTDAGADVEVIASHDGTPVLLRQGRFLVASFHPELTDDTRVHERFLELVREEMHVGA